MTFHAKVTTIGESRTENKPESTKYFREQRVEIPQPDSTRTEWSDYYGNKVVGKLINASQYGARILVAKQDGLTTFGGKTKISISVYENSIYSGMFTVVNETMVDEEFVSLGITLESPGVDLDQVKAVLQVRSSSTSPLQYPKAHINLSNCIRTEFKLCVADLNTLLQEIKIRLHEEEKRLESSAVSDNHKVRLVESAVTLAYSMYSEDIHEIFKKFKGITEALNSDESVAHKQYFRTNFHSIVFGTPFMNRAFNKPLGYAGDYGLMVMFYQYHDLGGTIFDKFMHRFSCNEPAAIANKNRVEFLSERLLGAYANNKSGDFKVSTIACGPAREMELFLSTLEVDSGSPKIDVICVDQDPGALAHAQSRLKPYHKAVNGGKLLFCQEDAVLGLIKQRLFCNDIRGSNVIVSAGLFDYLSDRVSSKMIESMFDLLKSGGELIIGNVSDQNPDKFSMEYFMDWQLILRSPEQLKSLVGERIVSSKAEVSVVSESLGLNLFLIIKKL